MASFYERSQSLVVGRWSLIQNHRNTSVISMKHQARIANEMILQKRIEKEGNDAMVEFSLIVGEEEERIQQVADQERERIIQVMRTNGAIHTCPLCLEETSPIRTLEENIEGKLHTMVCCGTSICNNCIDKSMDFMFGKSGKDPTNARCYSCREPTRSATYWAKAIMPNDKRHWLLNALAKDYITGTNGLKKNTKKAIELYQRAAELGNTSSQATLSEYYFLGLFVPKCYQKAKYYAEKAADQGEVHSQFILADLIKADDSSRNTTLPRTGVLLFDIFTYLYTIFRYLYAKIYIKEEDTCSGKYSNNEEEFFRLYTLAAFQGSPQGRFALAMYYHERYDLRRKIGDDKDSRRNMLLLTIYWCGKTAEVEGNDPKGSRSLAAMALTLNLAMAQVWHPPYKNSLDPNPGYSHIPFITWALAKGGTYTDFFSHGRPFDYYWKRECANCGSREKEHLKACARCKSFHYCSKKCQVEHWKAGHKVDCNGHWIEKFFPAIRNVKEN